MKNKTLLIICYLLAAMLFFTCRKKDDKDFIRFFIKTAQQQDIEGLEKMVSEKYKEDENIMRHAEMLIQDMVSNEIPEKEEIKQNITTPEFPGYTFVLKPNNIKYMISLDKTKRPTQILHLVRIGEIIPNKKLEFVD